MKRKIFTLLVAFMALAAFHVKAQISGAEAPAILNVGAVFDGNNYSSNQIEMYPRPFYEDSAPTSLWNKNDRTDYPNGMFMWRGYFSLDQDGKLIFKKQKGGGQFGNLNDYFTVEPLHNNGTTRQYYFWTYGPNGSGRTPKQVVIDGHSLFEFVRFADETATSKGQAQIVDDGGYMCVPSATGATADGRQMVVIDVRTNEFKVVSYKDYAAHRAGGPINANGNWIGDDMQNPGGTGNYYVAVWMRANGVTGRWARYTDFQHLQDFIQLTTAKGEIFNVKGTDGKMYDKFKIGLTGVYDWYMYKNIVHKADSAGHNFAMDPLYDGVNINFRSPTKDSIVLDRNGFIQLFSLVSPENANNVVTAAKSKNIFTTQMTFDDNAFGDSLLLLPPVRKDRQGQPGHPVASNPATNTCLADTGTQQFALWIEPNGSVGLYPFSAYDYEFGEDQAHQPPTPRLRPNLSIQYNAPVIPSGYKVCNTCTPDDFGNYAYRIALAQNTWVVGPSSLDKSTYFTSSSFFIKDVTRYNYLDEKRYFYLESTVPGRDGKPLVIDLVKHILPNGDIQKKIVLTDREVNRFKSGVARPTDTTYYNTPYDSLNMSACWSVRKLYNTDYDASLTKKIVVGYVFVNEEGDTLQYAPNNLYGNYPGMTPGTWGADPTTIDSMQTNSFLKNYSFWYGPGYINNSYTWKALGFKEDNNDYFFLMNMNGAALWDGVQPNVINDMRPQWDIRLDTVRSYYQSLCAGTYTYYNPFDTTEIYNYFYKSGSPGQVASKARVRDFVRKTFYYDSDNYRTYRGLKFKGIDSVAQRNIGAYIYDSIPESYQMPYIPTSMTDNYPIYRLENTFGLEVRLAPIHVNVDTTLAPHDSINAQTGKYEWERYRVDSLWTYLYKTPGNYAIKEALGWSDIMRVADGDAVPKQYDTDDRVAFMGMPNWDKSVMGIVPVDSAFIAGLQGYDNNVAPGYYGAGDNTSSTHSYKWYHIYYIQDPVNKPQDTLWMVLDTVRPILPPMQKYGFYFKNDGKANAGKFRFYQPLVADKEQEFFLIETQVPDKAYSANYNPYTGVGTFTSHNFLDDKGVLMNGTRIYALLNKDSKQITVTKDPKLATRWDFTQKPDYCKIDYIDNNFLAETKMYGAPLQAQRWYNDNFSYLHIANNEGWGKKGFNLPESVTEDSGKYAITFTLVPAAKIEATKYPTSDQYYGIINRRYNNADHYYYGNNPALTASHFEFKDQSRDVQLYYVRQIITTENGSDTTFMTVSDKNIFYQTLPGTTTTNVTGQVITFEPYKNYSPVKMGANTYENDTTLLQMFAIYGKLGLDEDRWRMNESNEWELNKNCISPAEFEYNFGQFIFVPAASYTYDYNKKEIQALQRNLKIGDADVYNEYRLGQYTTGGTKYKSQLIVVPSEAALTPGVTASEYVFKYKLYTDPIGCTKFIDDANKETVAANGLADYNHDYADPSSQWNVPRYDWPLTIKDSQTVDWYKYYEFDPIALQKRNQAPVSQTELTEDYFLYLISEGKTKYDGATRTYHAVKKFEKDNQGNYIIDEVFDNDVHYMTIVDITQKGGIGNVDVITGEGENREYNGDSTIDYFYKFTPEDLYSFDWKILESVYAERYVWSKPYENAISGFRMAYAQDVTPDRPAEYLEIRPSVADTIGYCNGTPLHVIPYYNIVYVNANKEEYYLKMDQTGKLDFEYLNTAQKESIEDLSNRNYRPDLKFCFPYKMRDYNKIEYMTDSKDSLYYNSKKVFIQSMVAPGAPKPGLVKISGASAVLAGSMQPDLYTIDYTKTEKQLDATTWIFGNNAKSDEVWIRLNDVPNAAQGWLRQADRATGDDYFVIGTKTPTADNVEYAESRNGLDIKNVYGNIDAAKLTFVFEDSALLPGYDAKRIWYYQIKNDKGEILTSAGYNPADPTTKPADSLINLAGTAQAEGYAYFTKDSIANDTKYKQLFGLKYIKPADGVTENPFAFWVVAGVDSSKSNSNKSSYYYLAEKNGILVFRYGGGTKQQETEGSAMQFLFGKVNDGKFTDLDDLKTDGFVAYGINDAVEISNAEEGMIELYAVDGRLMKSVATTGSTQTIPAPKGVVIVKNANNVVKVVVK